MLQKQETMEILLESFDAQRFELFLYIVEHNGELVAKPRFDAQCFELFLYKRVDYDGGYGFQCTFRCSTFRAFSL